MSFTQSKKSNTTKRIHAGGMIINIIEGSAKMWIRWVENVNFLIYINNLHIYLKYQVN